MLAMRPYQKIGVYPIRPDQKPSTIPRMSALPEHHQARLYRQVAAQLVELINSGEYKVGERLPPERELCLRLGVSRPSLREALIALEMERRVEVRSGSGIYVLRPPVRPIGEEVVKASDLGPFDVIRARAHLEAEVASQAVKNATPKQLEEIEQCLQEMYSCQVGDPQLHDADRRFHLAVAQASGNAAYPLLLDLLWKHRTTPLYHKLENHFLSASVWQKSMEEHQRIFDALKSRDLEAAKEAMRVHMRNAENRLASKLD